MRWKESEEKQVWSQWCVENSSICNKAKQEDEWNGGTLGPCCESQPNALLPLLQRLERALTVLGIPAAKKSSSSVVYCNNALEGFFSFLKYLFIWLHLALDAACGIYFPDQGWNPDSLLWKSWVLTPDYQGSPLDSFLNYSCKERRRKKMHLSLSLQESNQKMNGPWCINDGHMMGFWEAHHMSSWWLFLCCADLFLWTLRTQVGLLELAGRKMFRKKYFFSYPT